MTINAEDHAIFKKVHRPEINRASGQQGKRMVILLPRGLNAAWSDALAKRSMHPLRK